MKYFWNILIAIDQLANAILAGNPDETISSRCGKKVRDHGRKYKLAYYLCRILHPIDKNHCFDAIEDDE